MSDEDQATLKGRLIEANRALVALNSIGLRDGNQVVELTLRAALMVYAALLQYQGDTRPTGEAASRLQSVTDHLRARLRVLGEPM